MFNEYAIERLGREKVTVWLHEAEADRRALLATRGQDTGGLGNLARKVGSAVASAFRSIIHPPVTPLDIPFGHAG